MIAASISYGVISFCFRVFCVGMLSAPDHGQNLVPMPPKKELKLDKDGLQQHLGVRMTPAQLQRTIEGSTHAPRFQPVIDGESGICVMKCHSCNRRLSAYVKAKKAARSDNVDC